MKLKKETKKRIKNETELKRNYKSLTKTSLLFTRLKKKNDFN